MTVAKVGKSIQENDEEVEIGLDSAELLYNFTPIQGATLSPDGKQLVYPVQRIDHDTEKKHTDLWLVQTDGSTSLDAPSRRITWSDSSNSSPQWSPDGTQIAFMSNRDNEKISQIYLLPISGGEARPLTDLKARIISFNWSPDSTQLVLSALQPDEIMQKMLTGDEKQKKLGVTAYHYDTVSYKFDSMGFLPTTKPALYLANADTGECTQLTDGEVAIQSATFSPDGTTLLFSANLHPTPTLHPHGAEVELYTIPTDLPEEPLTKDAFTKITTTPGQINGGIYSPDGTKIAYIGSEFADSWWQNNALFVHDLSSGETTGLSLPHDFECVANTIGDIIGVTPQQSIEWSADGTKIYAAVSRHGEQSIATFDASTGDYTKIVEGGTNGTFQLSKDTNTLTYLHLDHTCPGDFHILDIPSGKTTALTAQNQWLADHPHGSTEMIWIESKDGYKIQGWILTPPNFNPKKQYPTIIEVHGGPQTQYGNSYMHEFHYLAANGYVVAYCNPRGGQGYGNDHAKAIHTKWGTVDVDDIMAWTDYVEALPYVDGDKMGITGGSYGGLMTAWLLGRTNRFKAAVAQRSVTNWLSMWGSADFNHGWSTFVGLPHPWEDPMANWEQSPMSKIGNATTPTLVIHSFADYRTNFEQSEQLYVALKVLGVDSELVVFPDESHGLSRGGRTDRRIARLEHMLRWFDKYLK